jgi:hypothetical protein
MRFEIGNIVFIKKKILFSKGYRFRVLHPTGGVLYEGVKYKISDWRKIEYSNGSIQYEYFIGKKSVWVKENDIYKCK